MNRTVAANLTARYDWRSQPLADWFARTAGAILAVTGVAKIWSALGTSKFLAVVDPIIKMKFGQLMLAVGLAEIAVALVCFFSRRRTLALGLVAWLATNFLVYRVGLWWIGLEATMWVSGASYGRPPPLTANGGQHHESPARLPAHRQLRAGDLAMEKVDA